MAAYVKYNVFSEQLTRGNSAVGTDTYKLALTNTAPNASTDVTFSTVTYPAPAAANGYPLGGNTVTLTVTPNSPSAGTTTVSANQSQFTATAGGIGPFRYAILYNSTDATNNLVAYWDYGSSITLSNAGDTFTVLFNNATTNGTVFAVS